MQGSKLKFFWGSFLNDYTSFRLLGTTLSTGDYSIDYMFNWLEVNSFKGVASPSGNGDFYFDGSTNYKCDYLLIAGHNLNGLTLGLHSSTDGNYAGEEILQWTEPVNSSGIFLKEFSSISVPYYRIYYTSSTSLEPSIKIMSLGTKTELDYIQPPFDPYGQETKANVNLSQGGYVTGIHEKYTERDIQINLLNQSTSVYNAIKTWRETHGVQNFAMAWDSTGSSADVWLVRPDMSFKNPINVNHLRDITINLKGRKI